MPTTLPGLAPELLASLIEAVERDPAFVDALISDAASALRGRLGVSAPDGLRVAEAAGGLLSVSLGSASVTLPDPRDRELAEAELEEIMGGASFTTGGSRQKRRIG